MKNGYRTKVSKKSDKYYAEVLLVDGITSAAICRMAWEWLDTEEQAQEWSAMRLLDVALNDATWERGNK